MACVSNGTWLCTRRQRDSLGTRQKSAINAACLFVWFKAVCESQADPPNTHITPYAGE